MPVKKRPPKEVLDSLKKVDKNSPFLKTASNTLPAKKMATPTKVVPMTKLIPATPTTHQDVIRKKAMSKSKALVSKSPPKVPAPPPPPPPPLISKPRPHPSYQRSRSVTTHHRILLQQVRTSGRKVAAKLRPVETIEKRAFRVGMYMQ